MTKFIITTESGSDLPQEMIQRYNVYIIPMHVTMGKETYPDGSFKVQKAFDFYDETGELPKTSGTTPQDNTNVFQRVFDKHPDAHIIHIAYSAVTTVSFNAAKIAAEDYENIHLVDAKNVTIGLAAIVKATAEFIEEHPNTTPESIIDFVEDIRERTRLIFLPKTLTYLKAGGRVSSLAFYGATLLRLHPSIILENGYLVPGKKYRGSFERSLRKMIDTFFTDHNIDAKTVLVGGAPGVTDDHKHLIDDLLNENNVPKTDWIETGAVISCHGGPGAIGIVGFEKN